MKRIKRYLCFCMLFVFLASMLGGCGDNSTDNKLTELNIGIGSSPVTIDPQLITDTGSAQVAVFFTSTLYAYNERRELVPELAESCDVSDDGLTVTYHLKEGLRWSNGDPLTSDDFAFAFKRLIDPATKSNSVYLITDCCRILNAYEINTGEMSVSELGVYAPDDLTFVVKLEQPCPYLNSLFTMTNFSPCPREFCNSCGSSYATSPDTVLSCGPYILDRYEPLATQIHLVRNPDYFNADQIELPGVTLQVAADPQQAMMCYSSDQLDIISVSGELAELAQGDDHMSEFSVAAVLTLEINHLSNTALKNRNIRLAIAKSIDRESITRNVSRFGYYPMTRVIPPDYYTETDGTDFARDQTLYDEYMQYEPEKAAEYWAKGLNELGVSSIHLDYVVNNAQTKYAEAIKAQLETNLNGLELEIIPLPAKEWISRLSGRDYDLIQSSWVADYADPTALFHGSLGDGSTNHYFDRDFLDMYDKSFLTYGEERNLLLHKMEDKLMTDVAMIPLFGAEYNYLIADGVTGFQVNPTGTELVITGLRKELK